MTVKTRFAPSPTGFLHIGGARTALFSYLDARRHGGQFILRVEDTDRERSTEAAVQAILDGMAWLGLEHDEGPFYQTQRFDRYREVARTTAGEAGKAYHCWMTKEELEAMRADQDGARLKPRYNGYWRDRHDAPPAGVTPVIRFKNPLHGVSWSTTGARPGGVRQRRTRRPDHLALGRIRRPTTSAWWWTTPTCASPT
jgi:glutamyl-tRNA synthetase